MALCRTRFFHCPLSLFFLVLLFFLLSPARAYFVFNQPSSASTWANGSPYPVTWSKGSRDGVTAFDIEITSLEQRALYYVARNVPSSMKSLNVLLEDVPEGDDYFLVCLDSTFGIIYSVSNRFTITNSSLAHSNPSPYASVPTATITGPSGPLATFNLTLGPAPNIDINAASIVHIKALSLGAIVVLFAALLGGALTLW